MSWAIAGAVSQEAAREESPDSGIAAARRAIQGNAPANGRGPLPASQRKLRGWESGYGKCHREYTAGAQRASAAAQRETLPAASFGRSSGKGEKVG